MTAAVYVVGGPTDRECLRYSLRSLINAPVVDDAWVVGDVPAWVRSRGLPLEPVPGKFANQRQSLTAFVNHRDAPDRFYLFNDDMFITEPIVGGLPVCRSERPASWWLWEHRKNPNRWHQAVLSTAEWVRDRLGADPPVYECHTPLLFDTSRLRGVLAAYPPGRPFAASETYPIAGAGGPGVWLGDAKLHTDDEISERSLPFLSTSPDMWAARAGEAVRGLFPEPCRYEKG